MKKGFTLVELSIVLVIIGLLIGGILVGQSMISTSKIQSFVRQIQQMDVAVSDFKNKYGQLPGNTNLMSFDPAGGTGNTTTNGGKGINSGYIGCYACTATSYTPANWWPTESYNFWYELSQAGDLSKQYKGDTWVNGMTPGIENPATVLDPNVAFVALSHVHDFYDPSDPLGTMNQAGAPVNIYMFQKKHDGSWNTGTGWPVYGNTLATLPFDCPTIAAVDTKMDDGMPNTGIVAAVFADATGVPASGVNGPTPSPVSEPCTGYDTSANRKYILNDPNARISMAIPIMSQTVGSTTK